MTQGASNNPAAAGKTIGSETTREKLDDYYANAGSWADERTQSIYSSRKVAWIVALIAASIAILEAIAIVFMLPLKTVVPQTILVDKQTGFVQALDPSQPQKIAPQKALTQSFLVQYVEAREAFDIATVQGQFKKVALWTGGPAKSRYVNMMQAGNPESPLSILPRTSVIDVQVRSVSQLSESQAMVRFATIRRDQGGAAQVEQNWVAVIKYRYSSAPMTAADRYVNPLGFEVLDYKKDAETLPTGAPEMAAPSTGAASPQANTPSLAQPLIQSPAGGAVVR
jgi:type IV secretion system protein VirB8